MIFLNFKSPVATILAIRQADTIFEKAGTKIFLTLIGKTINTEALLSKIE